jgi:2-oxoglutarate dehydrogenase E1 component
MAIREIVKRAQEVYCGTIGYEYMHIPSVEECNWIRSKVSTAVWPN